MMTWMTKNLQKLTDGLLVLLLRLQNLEDDGMETECQTETKNNVMKGKRQNNSEASWKCISETL